MQLEHLISYFYCDIINIKIKCRQARYEISKMNTLMPYNILSNS